MGDTLYSITNTHDATKYRHGLKYTVGNEHFADLLVSFPTFPRELSNSLSLQVYLCLQRGQHEPSSTDIVVSFAPMHRHSQERSKLQQFTDTKAVSALCYTTTN